MTIESNCDWLQRIESEISYQGNVPRESPILLLLLIIYHREIVSIQQCLYFVLFHIVIMLICRS